MHCNEVFFPFFSVHTLLIPSGEQITGSGLQLKKSMQVDSFLNLVLASDSGTSSVFVPSLTLCPVLKAQTTALYTCIQSKMSKLRDESPALSSAHMSKAVPNATLTSSYSATRLLNSELEPFNSDLLHCKWSDLED